MYIGVCATTDRIIHHDTQITIFGRIDVLPSQRHKSSNDGKELDGSMMYLELVFAGKLLRNHLVLDPFQNVITQEESVERNYSSPY